MALIRHAYFEAIAACALPACMLLACGARPDAPGRAEGNGAGSSGLVSGSESSVDDDGGDDGDPEVEVEIPSLEPTVAPDAGAPDAAAPTPPEDPGPAPAPPPEDLQACFALGVDCTGINVAVSDVDRGLCIQLSIDNCGAYSRAGLPVDLPAEWRLGSASLGDLAEGCALGAFDPDSTIIVDASGTIGWNEATPRPSELVIDVTLEPSPTASQSDPVSVSVTFPAALPDCTD